MITEYSHIPWERQRVGGGPVEGAGTADDDGCENGHESDGRHSDGSSGDGQYVQY